MPILEQVREHIETDLSDEALGRVIADAVETVEGRWGTDDEMTHEFNNGRDYPVYLTLYRQVLTITEVTDDDTVLVEDTDFRVLDAGRTLMRIDRRWGRRVVVTYTPRPEISFRDMMVIDLVKLSLTFNGLVKSERVGDAEFSGSMTMSAYHNEREFILRRGANNRSAFRFA
jgi:hypothetical protein